MFWHFQTNRIPTQKKPMFNALQSPLIVKICSTRPSQKERKKERKKERSCSFRRKWVSVSRDVITNVVFYNFWTFGRLQQSWMFKSSNAPEVRNRRLRHCWKNWTQWFLEKSEFQYQGTSLLTLLSVIHVISGSKNDFFHWKKLRTKLVPWKSRETNRVWKADYKK